MFSHPTTHKAGDAGLRSRHGVKERVAGWPVGCGPCSFFSVSIIFSTSKDGQDRICVAFVEGSAGPLGDHLRGRLCAGVAALQSGRCGLLHDPPHGVTAVSRGSPRAILDEGPTRRKGMCVLVCCMRVYR